MSGSKSVIIYNNLDEVSFIRPILILMVVLYHTMCIHTGNWDLPEGITVIPAYKAIGKVTYSFMLEAFVFVSGYVWAYQHEKKGLEVSLWVIFRKKGQRLLLPTIIFGLLYILLFEKGAFSINHLIEGPGHLWFLPMLFECFVIGWLILNSDVAYKWVFPIIFIAAIFVPKGLPIRLSLTTYYLPFFFVGYWIYNYREKLRAKIKIQHVIISWLVFVVAYSCMVVFRFWILSNVHDVILIGGCKNACMIVYSSCGTMALYFTSVFVTSRIKLSRKYIKMGTLCMGVYIFQQFLLKSIYYQTNAPLYIDSYVLPFIAFIVTVPVSLLLTVSLRKLKYGRKLL